MKDTLRIIYLNYNESESTTERLREFKNYEEKINAEKRKQMTTATAAAKWKYCTHAEWSVADKHKRRETTCTDTPLIKTMIFHIFLVRFAPLVRAVSSVSYSRNENKYK